MSDDQWRNVPQQKISDLEDGFGEKSIREYSEFNDLWFDSCSDVFGPDIRVSLERGYSKSSFRNTIVCTLYKIVDDETDLPGFMSIGISTCSKEDIFDLFTGRKLAFRRALEEIGNENLRTRLWKDFIYFEKNERVKND